MLAIVVFLESLAGGFLLGMNIACSVDPPEALQFGLVSKVVPDSEVEEAVRQLFLLLAVALAANLLPAK